MIWSGGLSGCWILAGLAPKNTHIVLAPVLLGLAALCLGFLSLSTEFPVLGLAAASTGSAGCGGCNANPPGCRVRQARDPHYLAGTGTR